MCIFNDEIKVALVFNAVCVDSCEEVLLVFKSALKQCLCFWQHEIINCSLDALLHVLVTALFFFLHSF